MRAGSRSLMTMSARSGRGSCGRGRFSGRSIGRASCPVRSVGAARADPGRARAARRGWVVTAEVCWSRVIAGALIFSKEAPDILWGLGRCLERLGVLPEKLVWDREARDRAGGGRPTERVRRVLRAARGRLGDPRAGRSAGEGGAGALAPVHALELRARSPVREPPRLPVAARRLVRAGSTGGCTARSARSRSSGWRRSASGCGRCPIGCRTSTGAQVIRVPAQPYLRVDRNDYSIDPRFAGRRVEVRVSQEHVTAVVLDTGELACRHRALFAAG